MQKTIYDVSFINGEVKTFTPLMLDHVMAEKELVARGGNIRENSIEFMAILTHKVCRRTDRENTPLDLDTFLESVLDIDTRVEEVTTFPEQNLDAHGTEPRHRT
ncbi:hypothetical protein FRC0431_01843 [Corynebacterium diphtheriae]|nr:hypothetical protein FRC0431_01843 [Corynebacterium diphtheriae]